MIEKKRITITGNKMPDKVYAKLEKLGNERKLTPYISNLVEKEEQMDKLIEGLSILTSQLKNIEAAVSAINQKLDHTNIQSSSVIFENSGLNSEVITDITQGKLDISDTVVSAIEENIDEPDF